MQLTLKTPLINGLKWLRNWRSKVSFQLQNLKKANPEETDVKTETWELTSPPFPFPLLLSNTPQTKAQQRPKGQGSCLKLCFMRYQPGKSCSGLGPGKLGLREGATGRLDTKHRGSSDARCEHAGKRRVSGQSRAEKSEGFLKSSPQQFRLASQEKGLPSPNKPSGLQMILIHTVVELASNKT